MNFIKCKQIEWRSNEKQKVLKAAEKFVSLINKTSQDKILKNFVKLTDDKQQQISQQSQEQQEKKLNNEFDQIENHQKLVLEKLNDQNQTNEQKIQFLENLIKDMDQKYNQMLIQQKEQIKAIQANVKQINEDLKDAGVQQKAILQRELQKLQEEEEESVFNYYKTFYWSSLNMFQTYRVISTGLVSGNYKGNSSNFLQENQQVISKGLSIGLEAGKDICKGVIKAVPIVDIIVDTILEAGAAYTDRKNEVTFQNKVNQINKIITEKFTSEEDISIKLSQAAIKITKIRRNIINIPKSNDGYRQQSVFNWVKGQIRQIDDSVFDKTELYEKNNQGVQQALQDVVLLISYLCLNSDRIVKLKKQDISDIIVDVIEKNCDDLLKKDIHERTSTCCSIF